MGKTKTKKLLWLPDPEEVDFSGIKASELRKKFTRRNYTNSKFITSIEAVTFFYLASSDFNLRRMLLNYERERVSKLLTNVTQIRKFCNAIGLNKIFISTGRAEFIKIPFEVAVLNNLDIPRGMRLENSLLIADKTTLLHSKYSSIEELARDIVVSHYISIIEGVINTNTMKIIKEYSNPVLEELLKMFHVRTKPPEKLIKPPCIQKIEAGEVSVGARNNSLFALINYYKYIQVYIIKKVDYSEIEKRVREANSRFPEPLSEKELTSLINYHLYGARGDTIYSYCGFIRKNAPELCPFKDRNECREWFKSQLNSKKRGLKNRGKVSHRGKTVKR